MGVAYQLAVPLGTAPPAKQPTQETSLLPWLIHLNKQTKQTWKVLFK